MSDFFARAAQRAVGMGPRVEPVLAPRFAPLAAADPAADPFTGLPADASPDPIVRRGPSHPSPAIDPPSIHAPAIPRAESRSESRAESRPAPRDASPARAAEVRSEVRAEPARPSTPPASASPAPRARHGRSAVPPIAPPSPDAIEGAVESATSPRIDLGRASPARPASASRRDPSPAPRSAEAAARADAHLPMVTRIERGERTGAIAGSVRPAAEGGAIVPRSAVSRDALDSASVREIEGSAESRGDERRAGAPRPAAKAEPWVAESAARAAAAEAAAPEPVVKVSIGRVEVRAVFPAPQPAPAARAPRPAPAQSPLQEYLRERNREARP